MKLKNGLKLNIKGVRMKYIKIILFIINNYHIETLIETSYKFYMKIVKILVYQFQSKKEKVLTNIQ